MEILFIIIIAVLVVALVMNKRKEEKSQFNDDEYEVVDTKKSEELPYQKKYLLTKNEWYFYKKLKPIADKYHLHILSKVRLADLIEVKKGLARAEYKYAFNRIKAKHIDFVLADPSNLAIKLAIELDDRSHEEINGQQRDYFVNKALKVAGVPILRINSDIELEKKICESLKIEQKGEVTL